MTSTVTNGSWLVDCIHIQDSPLVITILRNSGSLLVHSSVSCANVKMDLLVFNRKQILQPLFLSEFCSFVQILISKSSIKIICAEPFLISPLFYNSSQGLLMVYHYTDYYQLKSAILKTVIALFNLCNSNSSFFFLKSLLNQAFFQIVSL